MTLAALDRNVVFNNETYLASVGFDRTAISATEGFRTDTAEFDAFIDEDNVGGITAEDLRIGRYIGASYTLFVVNWENTADNGILRRGRIGQILRGQTGKLRIELDSLNGLLDLEGGEVYSPTCRADVGDARCKVPISPPEIIETNVYNPGDYVVIANNPALEGQVRFANRIYEAINTGTTPADISTPGVSRVVGVTSTVGTVDFLCHEAFTREGLITGSPTSASLFNAAVTDIRAVDGWFTFGVVTFSDDTTGGQNAGVSREVKSWVQSSGSIEVYLPFPFVPQTGDRFAIYPGCAKTRDNCVNKFRIPGSQNFPNGNILNFRGEPDLPGPDYVFTYPDAQ